MTWVGSLPAHGWIGHPAEGFNLHRGCLLELSPRLFSGVAVPLNRATARYALRPEVDAFAPQSVLHLFDGANGLWMDAQPFAELDGPDPMGSTFFKRH